MPLEVGGTAWARWGGLAILSLALGCGSKSREPKSDATGTEGSGGSASGTGGAEVTTVAATGDGPTSTGGGTGGTGTSSGGAGTQGTTSDTGGGASGTGGGSGGSAGGASGGSGGGAGAPGVPPALPPARTVDCLPDAEFYSPESFSFTGRWFVYLDTDGNVALHDRMSGETSVVVEAVADAYDPPGISRDGSRIGYGAGNGNASRAYIANPAGETLADYASGNEVRSSFSYDGSYVAFSSRSAATEPPPNYYGGIVWVDLGSGETLLASVNDAGEGSNEAALTPDLSDDGRRVVFYSQASNLVPGKPERRQDAYFHDLDLGTTRLVSRTPDGEYGNEGSNGVRISGDGDTIVFTSRASDLVSGDSEGTTDIFLFDPETEKVRAVTLGHEGSLQLKDISSDGRFVLLASSLALSADDTNDVWDGFVYDVARDEFKRCTADEAGGSLSQPSIPISMSGDGQVVAFETRSPELSEDYSNVVCFTEWRED